MEKAAQRILNAARKENIGISWIQRTYEGEERCSLEFYNVISGIAYFLFKAFLFTGRTDYRNHADQAMQFLLKRMDVL
jgi:lantibiotic modifying enzyme